MWRNIDQQTRINFWLVMSVLVLCLAVVYFTYQGRVGQWEANVNNCNTVTVPGSLAASARDNDLAFFASTAADARRADGQKAIADKYDSVAVSARNRSQEAAKRAGVPCTDRYKRPGFFAQNGGSAVANDKEGR